MRDIQGRGERSPEQHRERKWEGEVTQKQGCVPASPPPEGTPNREGVKRKFLGLLQSRDDLG